MKNVVNKKKQTGFTLIELLVVIIIVAVLAAVGIPLLTANVEKAKLTEADAGLSTVRIGMRAHLAEHGKYETPVDLSVIGIKLPDASTAPATPGDLDGRYFSTDAYSATATTDFEFCAAVDGGDAGNVAIAAAEVADLDRSIDEQGNIYGTADCTGTILNKAAT